MGDPMFLRLVRLARVVRLLKLLKTFQWCDTLFLTISACKASMSVLFWGMVLLLTLMTMFALMIHGMLVPYMRDESKDVLVRASIYAYWGSFTRCVVTMFEITLGNWVPAARLIIDNVGESYWVVFIGYKATVGFGLVKVVSAVFLHETFHCADSDDELIIQKAFRTMQRHRRKMEVLFHEADVSGDGRLTAKEFKEITQDKRVSAWLQGMGMPVRDPDVIFTHLASREDFHHRADACNRWLTVEELTQGMTRLRGNALAFDMLALHAECADIRQMATSTRIGLATMQRSMATFTQAMSAMKVEFKEFRQETEDELGSSASAIWNAPPSPEPRPPFIFHGTKNGHAD